MKSLDKVEEPEDIVVKIMGFGGKQNYTRNITLLVASLEKKFFF